MKWHLRGIDKLRPKKTQEDGSKRKDDKSSPKKEESSRQQEKQDIYQRYCHVYQKGELPGLVALTPNLKLEKEYFDTGNWAVIATKEVKKNVCP